MKLTKHAWIIWVISLIAVLALALLIPFIHTAVYWIALGCTGAMFVLGAFTFARAFRKDKTLESRLLSWPIFRVGYTATAVQTVLGFILMALSRVCPVWCAVLAEIILFAAAGLCLTAKDAARAAVARFEGNVPDRTGAWKAIRARANALAAESGNPEMRRLSEEIRFADPNPCSLDAKISAQLEIIAQNADEESVRKAFEMLRQRRDLIKREK